MTYRLYLLEKSLLTTRDLEGLTPDSYGVALTLALPERDLPEYFGIIYTGYVHVPTPGIYTFHTISNDGSRLFIGGDPVVDNDGPHGASEQSGQIALEAGHHPMRLEYFQAGAGKALEVFMEGPGMIRQSVPAERLMH